jgi:diguanylate cyclase (GGDEF)-like protein
MEILQDDWYIVDPGPAQPAGQRKHKPLGGLCFQSDKNASSDYNSHFSYDLLSPLNCTMRDIVNGCYKLAQEQSSESTMRKKQKNEAKLTNLTDLQTRIDRMNNLAWELRDTDPDQSQNLSATAHELSTSAPFDKRAYRLGVILSLRGLAYANRRAGNLAQSLSQSMQVLAYLANIRLPGVEADTLQNVAIIMGYLGNFAEGLEYGFKALVLAQSISDREREGHILNSIGVLYVHSKNIDESLRIFRQALRLNHKLGQKRYEGLTLNNMALAHSARGNHQKARDASLRALHLAEETKFSNLIVTATGTIGETYLAMGEYSLASQYLQHYLTAARSTKSKRDEAWALILLGETDLRQKRESTTLAYLHQALALVEQVGLRMEKARCHELLAEMYEQQGNLKEALAQLRLFYQTKEAVLNETTAQRIANLQVIHQMETIKRDAEIQHLKTVELQREIEERKKKELALEELATIDPLTGILNRRKFSLVAEREIQDALQRHRSLSIILLDIDHFKKVNDRYGHAIGDQVLTDVAEILQVNLRTEEIVGRIGGDEFATILPGSNQRQGQQIAKRLKKKIVSHPFRFDRGSFSITVSIGIAEFDPRQDEDLGMLFNHADQAMYSAKRSGRNRIVFYRAKE